jgi:hypothetical protein
MFGPGPRIWDLDIGIHPRLWGLGLDVYFSNNHVRDRRRFVITLKVFCLLVILDTY